MAAISFQPNEIRTPAEKGTFLRIQTPGELVISTFPSLALTNPRRKS